MSILLRSLALPGGSSSCLICKKSQRILHFFGAQISRFGCGIVGRRGGSGNEVYLPSFLDLSFITIGIYFYQNKLNLVKLLRLMGGFENF